MKIFGDDFLLTLHVYEYFISFSFHVTVNISVDIRRVSIFFFQFLLYKLVITISNRVKVKIIFYSLLAIVS